jgi:CysZ protein
VNPLQTTAAKDRATSSFSEFFTGTRLLMRGFGFVMRRPSMLLLGLVPALLSTLIVVGGYAALWYFVWPDDTSNLLRTLVAVAILVAAAFVAVLTFTALTMIVGDPFYEVISKRVDDLYGGEPEAPDAAWHRRIWRNLSDSVRTLAVTLMIGVALFGAEFIPVAGQILVPVAEAAVGGWFLAVEISGIPFNRRGYRLLQRRQLLRANRALALGFGVPLFLMFLIPLAAVFLMPGAVAGATLMTRRALGQPHS